VPNLELLDLAEVDDQLTAVPVTTLAPVHPGEVLMEEFIQPLGVTGAGADRGRAGPDRFWLNLQTRYDLEVERDRLGSALDAIIPLRSA
jgi:plasmid maintenance system antidote protein VapI